MPIIIFREDYLGGPCVWSTEGRKGPRSEHITSNSVRHSEPGGAGDGSVSIVLGGSSLPGNSEALAPCLRAVLSFGPFTSGETLGE